MTRYEIGSHPMAETLAAYASGGLTDAVAAQLREHISNCGDCTAILLDLNDRWEPDDPELGSAWDQFQQLAPAQFPRSSGGAPTIVQRGSRSLPIWARVAAVLAIAVVGFWLGQHSASPPPTPPSRPVETPPTIRETTSPRGGDTSSAPSDGSEGSTDTTDTAEQLAAAEEAAAHLRSQLADLRRPIPVVPSVDLLPTGSLRTATRETLELRPEAPFVVVRLLLAAVEAPGHHRLIVADNAGGSVAQIDGLESDTRGNLVISLPSDRLEPGLYYLTLQSPDELIVARYELEVHADATGVGL